MSVAHSYLNASTGLSLDALHAGYRAKITLTPTPKTNEPPSTSGVNTGVRANPPAPPSSLNLDLGDDDC
jgi:hypothetical protein